MRISVWNKISTGKIDIDLNDYKTTISLSPENVVKLISSLSQALLHNGESISTYIPEDARKMSQWKILA